MKSPLQIDGCPVSRNTGKEDSRRLSIDDLAIDNIFHEARLGSYRSESSGQAP